LHDAASRAYPRGVPRKAGKPWFVYLVRCADGTLYTGVTSELERRIREHNESPRGARYTRGRRPVVLVYAEAREGRADAQQREAEIRRLSRGRKLSLVAAGAGKTVAP